MTEEEKLEVETSTENGQTRWSVNLDVKGKKDLALQIMIRDGFYAILNEMGYECWTTGVGGVEGLLSVKVNIRKKK